MNNPYSTSSRPGEAKQTVQARVSVADFTYFRRLLSVKTGAQDKIIATLFYKFVNELRSRGLDPNNPDHIAWEVDHPTNAIVDDILDSCTFGDSG